MITGDHAVTAVSIAKKIGLGRDDPEVIAGKELETMSDEDLFNKVKTVSVYARVSPQHKLRITQLLFLSMIAAFFAHLAVLYVPALQWVFRTVPLTATEWVSIGTITIVIAVETDKWIRRKRGVK